MVFDLVGGTDYRRASQCRRALRRMEALGLVRRRWYVQMQGRPASWEITETGREVIR
jgi:hypothetical protein